MQNHVVMEDSIDAKVTKMQHPNVGEILFYASQKLFITYNTHILIIDTISFFHTFFLGIYCYILAKKNQMIK